jgi:hypothetical protein
MTAFLEAIQEHVDTQRIERKAEWVELKKGVRQQNEEGSRPADKDNAGPSQHDGDKDKMEEG